MKTKIFIFLFFLSNLVYSQTEQLEKESMSKRFGEGEFSAETYKIYGNDWRSMINEIGGYPELPYDESSGQIKFKIIQTTEQSKKTNYNRILEWTAINFGALSSVLHYKDYESGKIVVKGWFDVTHRNEYKNFWGKSKEGVQTTKCYQTYIFTIKDSTVKTEIVDVRYKFKTYGYYSSSIYIPDRIFEVSIHEIYPITNFESSEWKENLDLLKQTSINIKKLTKNLGIYIKDYNDDYTF